MTDFFELYGIPECFIPDLGEVKKKYYELSRQYHPDKVAQASAAEQTKALQMAMHNNDAFKTLSSRDKTMAYLLKLKNAIRDDEKYNLPPSFLMEMMDINDIVSDMEPGDVSAVQRADELLKIHLDEWEIQTSKLTALYDEGRQTEEILMEIKEQYYRKKYLLRIKERINTFAAR